MTEEPEVTVGSGNVFADLGVPDPEEALRKADLARAIGLIIEARGLNQSQAADALGVDRTEAFFLRRGRLRGFSVERLRGLLMLLTQTGER
jgi:predicted XRE-type DNA-binding protein